MCKLLIVDDEAEPLAVFEKIAKQVGFDDIVCEQTAQAVLTRIDSGEEFDLAVIDVVLTRLPEKTGLDLIHKLKERLPDCKIIGLTGKGGTEFGVDALQAGADDFVSTNWNYIDGIALFKIRLQMWRGLLRGRIGV